MYKIKTCPFCGGKPYLETSHRAFIDGETTRVAFVRCTKCNARSGRFKLSDFGHTSRSLEANEAAVNDWNRRAEEVSIVDIITKDDIKHEEYLKKQGETNG